MAVFLRFNDFAMALLWLCYGFAMALVWGSYFRTRQGQDTSGIKKLPFCFPWISRHPNRCKLFKQFEIFSMP